MAGERQVDAADALLKGAATWEPPDGFVLRVIAASRADARRQTTPLRSSPTLDVASRLLAHVRAVLARRDDAAWVLRQYWLLVRGR